MSARVFIGKDLQGVPCDTIYPSSNIVRGVTPAGTPVEIDVPPNSDAAFFAFGGTGNVWVDSLGNEATLPSGSSESSTAELNPVSRFVTPGGTISLICSVINEYQVSFYTLNEGSGNAI